MTLRATGGGWGGVGRSDLVGQEEARGWRGGGEERLGSSLTPTGRGE